VTATQRILELDKGLTARKLDRDNGRPSYDWFDVIDDPRFEHPEGIDCETGEFLYGLVRIVKPRLILETGTRIGISTRYLALGLKDNELGEIITIERDGVCMDIAERKIESSGLSDQVRAFVRLESLDFGPKDLAFDMLYLDSEPEYRYHELVHFWPNLSPGGVIVIHDLPFLDHEGFGPMPDPIVYMLEIRQLRAMNFPTCSGLTLMQKAWDDDYQVKGDRLL